MTIRIAGTAMVLMLVCMGGARAQNTDSYESSREEKQLGEFYRAQLEGKVFTEPWLLYAKPHENPVTERIDAVFAPAHLPWINTAWVVMGMKTGMISERNIEKVTGALLDFWQAPDEKYFDLYGLQTYVAERYGIEASGDFMIARTRPPMRQQFAVRQPLMKTIVLMHDFQQVLLETAEKYKESVMPGYTHIRHAQPTTLGHYLMSVYDPVARSMKMVEDGYTAMSLNELGCGALAGTSWKIDRELVSEYLGLEGLIENTNDAVSYSDGYLLVVAGLTNIMNILSRMGLEMEFWSGLEYRFMDFEIGAGSYMMPNKRGNQTYLENTTVAAGQMQGALSEVSAMAMRIPHGDMQPLAYNMVDPVLRALQVVDKHVHPFLYHFPGMQVNEDRMLELAREGYSCATELTNEIVRRFGIDYRTAHEIVHVFVVESGKKGIPSREADIGEFQRAAEEVYGKKINLTEAELRHLLDPVYFVQVTDSQGAVSPREVQRMIEDRWVKLDAARARHVARIEKLEEGKKKMMDDLRAFYEQSR
jgi:argininosuccinate lyase